MTAISYRHSAPCIPYLTAESRPLTAQTNQTHKTKSRWPKSERGLRVSQAAFRSSETRELPREKGALSSVSGFRVRIPLTPHAREPMMFPL